MMQVLPEHGRREAVSGVGIALDPNLEIRRS